MTWDLVGGDPAPGATWAVANAATALRTVADLTDAIATSIHRDRSAMGPDVWSGSAADAFHGDIQKLTPQIDRARQSYSDAAGALEQYLSILETAQSQARAALSEAEQAESDREAAELRRAGAQQEADENYAAYEATAQAAWRVERQIAACTEPGTRIALMNQLANLEATGRHQWATHVDAGATAENCLAARTDAERRLADANNKAAGIRDEMSGAAQTLAAGLKQAEHEADLPNVFQRAFNESEEWWKHNEATISEALKVIGAVCSVIAIFVPVFAVVALALAGVVMLIDIAQAASDGKITGSEWLGLGMDALSLVGAGGPAVRVLAKGADEGGLLIRGTSAAATWAGHASDVESVGQTGEDVRERKYTKAILDASGMVVGGVAGKYAGPALRSHIAKMGQDPSVSDQLDVMSQSVGHNEPTLFGRHLPDDERQLIQSEIASPNPNYHGGQFLPGHSPGVGLPTDHSMTIDDMDDKIGEQAKSVVDLGHEIAEAVAGGSDGDSSAGQNGGGS